MHPVKHLLIKIEAEMKHLDLWAATPPSNEALASRQPFAIDTLSFDQWLQWIMLPRLDWIIQQNHCLPSNCHIAPYAEEAVKQLAADTQDLLRLIKQLDQALNRVH
ncbi:YqcC family protein [Pontibacter sp. JAM-7]|uniref:YqcC family protein n=1 Tax=Pontibacter sp. JAM-7 TaxID=3366581 RepID=UPI003AF85E90